MITREQDEQIRKLLKQRGSEDRGHGRPSYKEIAEKVGVSIFAVQCRRGKRPSKAVTSRVVSEVLQRRKQGMTYTKIAAEVGISYSRVFDILLAAGQTRANDTRSWQQKVESYVERLPNGCLRWIGPQKRQVHLTSEVRGSTRAMVNKWLGMPGVRTYGMTCGNAWCHNPEHAASTREFKRNDEIIDRWKKHMEHRTTMQKLADEFGITKQRVEQIIRAAGLPHKWQKDE